MQIKAEESTYRKALESSLERISFDRSSGESFSFEELFYPLEIDEGKYAFQSYAEQMELAHKLISSSSVTYSNLSSAKVQATEIAKKIRSLQSRMGSSAFQNESPQEKHKKDDPSVDNDNKVISKQILERIRSQQLNRTVGSELTTFEESQSEWAELLEQEPQFDHSSLIIPDNARYSRILAVASAGHGKTTLLRRIALYYCHPFNDSENHCEIRKKYSLSGDFIPCLIQLRDITDQNYSIAKAIEYSVVSVYRNSSYGRNNANALPENSVQKWISSVRSKLLLLVDGLDELSDSMRYNFLSALDDYLLSNSQTHVIMTSRVAGLSDTKIQSILRKMGFRGRSIIPLTDEDAKKYSERWIDVTQPIEQRAQLKSAIEQILNQNKFKYLKEFMRTPLELLLILKQIANDSFSLNRFQMFRDTLWEYFTNHVKKYDQKRPIYEDTMTLLSFIAYQMQLNDSMFISVHELEKLSDELNHLSFHTNLIKNGTLNDYREVLDSIAANVGIIERDDRTSDVVYTFPIRAYQEFLTAHACCHLRLNTELSKPNPCGVLRQHLNDSRWISITNFALSDLGTNNQHDFDAIINLIFKEISDIEQLRAVVEADLAITKDHALVLCDNVFSNQTLTEDQKELLIACMNTKSAYAYAYALKSSYQTATSDNRYLEANALSTIIWEYSSGRSAYKKAFSCLQSSTTSQQKLGAEMISVMSRTLMDEVSAAYKDKIRRDFRVSEDLLITLASNAKFQEDVFSVIALTNIWLSKADGSEKAKLLLDVELASLVIDSLNKDIPTIQELCLGGHEVVKSSEYKRVQEMVFSLGSIPFSSGTRSLLNHGQGNLFVSTFLQAMYQSSKDDVDVDQVAIATACLYYCWDINRFMEAWTSEICKGMPSEYVRKDMCSVREQNHFDLVRKGLIKLERVYRDTHRSELNSLNSPTSVFTLFKSGDILGAANFCIRTMGIEVTSNNTNLAFLIRYGHLTQDDLESQSEHSIPDLLAEGLKKQDSYALINMALYELDLKQYSQAKSFLDQISEEGWHDISGRFWYPELWQRISDPEGALVSVLAHVYGNCEFDDYDEMVETVKRCYVEIADKVLQI